MFFFRWLPGSILFMTMSFPNAVAQIDIRVHQREIEVPMGPWKTENTPLDLKSGQLIRVLRTAPQGLPPFVATRILDTEGTAVEMESIDEIDLNKPFEWTSKAPGKYQLQFRNMSSRSGSVVVRIFQPKGVEPVTTQREGLHARVRIYYATTRKPSGAKVKPAFYADDPAPDYVLSYGYCDVSIPHPDDRTLGVLESPSLLALTYRWNPDKHVMVLEDSLRQLSREEMMKRLAVHVGMSEKKDLLVFIHGFNTSFEFAARRTAQIAYDLNFPGVPFLFSWPSKEVSLLPVDAPLVYGGDETRAENSVKALQEVLTKLASELHTDRIHLIAHSMGNRVLTKALAGLPKDAARVSQFRHVALLAADIDETTFSQLAKDFNGTARDFTLYAAKQDLALKLSSWLHQYARSGQGQSKVVQGIEVIDASPVDTWYVGLGHDYFARVRPVLSDLSYLLQDIPAKMRHGIHPAAGKNKAYYVFSK
jgi:esterase/lipase superfamily enzyme